MSVTWSNSLPDLLCGEDSGVVSGESPECSSSDLDSSISAEESIAGFIEDERNYVPGFDYLTRFQTQSLDVSSREQSVAWILKVVMTFIYLFISDTDFTVIAIMPSDYITDEIFTSSVKLSRRSMMRLSTVGFPMIKMIFIFYFNLFQVQSFYNFQPLTAYLAVNYMDRFLYSRRLPVSLR